MLSPRVPGPRCPGISGDIPGCPRPGGSVRSQSPRSKMSWDIRRHPGMSQTWRQCQVPESQVQDVLGYPGNPGMSQTWRQCQVPGSQVQDVLGYPGTSRDVPDLEAVSGPRVPGPRCPGTSSVSKWSNVLCTFNSITTDWKHFHAYNLHIQVVFV